MKIFKLSILVIVLLAAFSWPMVSSAQNRGGAIFGHLIDAHGRNLKAMQKYVNIFAYQKGQWLEGAIGDDGQYEISNIPAGDWFVGAHVNERSGFVSVKIDAPISINSDFVAKDITLNVLDGVISGKVFGLDGNSTGPALVSLTDLATGEVTSRESKNGFYSFFVKAGNYVINALSAPAGDSSSQEEQSVIKKGQLADIALFFTKGSRKISGAVTPDAADVWVYAWSDKGSRSQTKTDDKGKFSLTVKDQDIWHLTAIKPGDGLALASEETRIAVNGADLVQNLAQTKKITLPKIKSQQFTSDQPATMVLDDGMTISFPAKSVPADKFTVTIAPALGPNQKGIELVSNFYEATVLDAQGKRITNLIKRAIVEIPYALAKQNSFGENFLRIFYWNPNLSAWQSNSNSAVDVKSRTVIGLTNYLAGFIVVNPNPPPPPPQQQQSSAQSVSSGGGTPTVIVPQLPTPPSIVNATALTDQSISISGTDFSISSNEKAKERYSLQRSVVPDASGFSEIAKELSIPAYLDTGLSPNTSYYYRFISIDSVGTSNPSVIASAQTLKDQTPPLINNVNVSFSDTGAEITFTTNELSSSKLNSGIDNLNEISQQQPNLANVQSYTIANSELKPDMVYQYQITATDANGNTVTGPVSNFTTTNSLNQAVNNIINQTVANPVVEPAPSATPKNLITGNLKIGSRGLEVKALQEFLIAQNFLSAGFNSGYFGVLTFQAVVNFQEKNAGALLKPLGLLRGTGFVGPVTRGFINKIIQSQ